MAMGRWQMHPAWYHDWMPQKVAVEASWDEVFRLALETFWNNHPEGERHEVHIAMVFHLGRRAVERGDWDAAYAERFKRFYLAETEES
jgi:hypothetical protein